MHLHKKEYFCKMWGSKHYWYRWGIVTYNGHAISWSKPYKNKTQCRNIGKKFALYHGLEWKE